MRYFVTGSIVLGLSIQPLLADFSYQQKATITGGVMASAMKVAGVFSRQAREPIETTVAVKGNRMVHKSATHVSIIDLDAQTITSVDMQRKTYNVMTFEQMKQAMDEAAAKLQQNNKNDANVNFKISSKVTGNSKQIAGLDTKEMLVKLEMQSTDQKSSQSGAMVIDMDVWMAPSVPGYEEVRNFYRRMAEKLDWTPGGSMAAGRSDIMKGMSEATKELSKLDGVPVFQTMTMNGQGQPGDGAQAQPQQQQQQQQQQSAKPSLGGMLGSRIGLSRKKDDSANQQPPANSTSNQQSQGPASLMEMTTELTTFSAAPVDASLFSVPAGFKKVDPDKRK